MRSVGQGTGPRPDWVARKFNHRSALFRVQNYVTIPEKADQFTWARGTGALVHSQDTAVVLIEPGKPVPVIP